MERTRTLRGIAEEQHGLVTRAQLRDLDLGRAARRGLVGRGELVPMGPQVFRIGGAPITERQTVLAACLEVGGVASHRTAAWLHHLLTGSLPPGPPEVMVRRPSGHHNPSPPSTAPRSCRLTTS